MNNLKKARALKLQFDQLGYAVVDGKITEDRSVYRSLLRSGKQEKAFMTTDKREYQINTFYKNFFKTNTNCLLRCDYKQVILCLMFNGVKGKPYFKATHQVTANLLKLKLLECYNTEQSIIVKDNYNNHTFFYCKLNDLVYRLVNNKTVTYNLK